MKQAEKTVGRTFLGKKERFAIMRDNPEKKR
jgi:hypothetical protein